MSVDELQGASLDAVIERWASDARNRFREPELFSAAESLSAALDCSADVERLLAPHCALAVRGGRVNRSFALRGAVAAALAAQNKCAGGGGRWAAAVSSWPAEAPRGIGVRTEYAAAEGAEGVALAFHDIFAFDLCGRAVRVERTVLPGSAAVAEEMASAIAI